MTLVLNDREDRCDRCDVLRPCTAYSKNATEFLKEYMDEESQRLKESNHVEKDELIGYIGALMYLHSAVCFLHDSLSRRITTQRDAYRLQGKSLSRDRKRRQTTVLLKSGFEKLVKQWCPGDENEQERIHLQAIGSMDMQFLTAESIVTYLSPSLLHVGNRLSVRALLPAEQAPGPKAPLPVEQQNVFQLFNRGEEAAAHEASTFPFPAAQKVSNEIDTREEEKTVDNESPSAADLVTFHPKRKADYTAEEWQGRQAKVARCSSIGELLRLFIGTEMMPSDAPLETAELDRLLQERLQLLSPRMPPLWGCAFTLPRTATNAYIFPTRASADARGNYYVTQTMAYPKKQKSKQVALFRAARILYPDETAHYCTLQRSDLNMLDEAKKSVFNFTDSARPLTEQLTAAFAEESLADVAWSVEEVYLTEGKVLPDGYAVKVQCGPDTYTCHHAHSVVSAFVCAMAEAEAQRKDGNNTTVAMWTEFLQVLPPVVTAGRDIMVYLFDHFFGVQQGQTSALDVVCTQRGTLWRAAVTLRPSLASADTVTIATAEAPTKDMAEEMALPPLATLRTSSSSLLRLIVT